MTGQNEFIDIFGQFTVADVIQIGLAIAFLVVLYRKFRSETVKKHDHDVALEKKVEEAHDATEKYPEYRKRSIEIQQELKGEIKGIKTSMQDFSARLEKLENSIRKREMNKLRDRLIQSYNYYANPETNPSGTWTKMEAEAFWELFRDYEELGGDGYMHTVVEPAMRRLIVVDVSDKYSQKTNGAQ